MRKWYPFRNRKLKLYLYLLERANKEIKPIKLTTLIRLFGISYRTLISYLYEFRRLDLLDAIVDKKGRIVYIRTLPNVYKLRQKMYKRNT